MFVFGFVLLLMVVVISAAHQAYDFEFCVYVYPLTCWGTFILLFVCI